MLQAKLSEISNNYDKRDSYYFDETVIPGVASDYLDRTCYPFTESSRHQWNRANKFRKSNVVNRVSLEMIVSPRFSLFAFRDAGERQARLPQKNYPKFNYPFCARPLCQHLPFISLFHFTQQRVIS